MLNNVEISGDVVVFITLPFPFVFILIVSYMTSLGLCCLEIINVMIAFQRGKIYIDTLMVLIKIQMKLSSCAIQQAASEIELCA